MSSEAKTELRDKIARALHRQATDDGEVHILWGGIEEHEEEVTEWLPFADAVLAVLDLDKVRARAQVEVLRGASMEFYRDGEGEWDGFGVSHALTLDADRIAREAGLETGESK